LEAEDDGADNEVHALDVAKFLVVDGDGDEEPLQLVLTQVPLAEVQQLREGPVQVLLDIALALAFLVPQDLMVQILVFHSVVDESSAVVPVLDAVEGGEAVDDEALELGVEDELDFLLLAELLGGLAHLYQRVYRQILHHMHQDPQHIRLVSLDCFGLVVV